MTTTDPWRCPNGTCPHPGVLHDRYDDEDPYPTCCAGDCRCGHPGGAVMFRLSDGTVIVESADPVILMAHEVWTDLGEPLDDPFALDTAGKYLYRYLRPAEDGRGSVIIGRVK
jgi:hypothetical protein